MRTSTLASGSSCKAAKAFQTARPLHYGHRHCRSRTVTPHATSTPDFSPASNRRDVLLTAPGLVATYASVAAALLSAQPAAAAAAAPPDCEFVSSPSGLQYCDVKPGEGPEPVKGALIRCHYTGRLASNNRVFDSSYERGRPLTFKIGVHEVISGWDLGILGTEGIPPMKEGGKRVLLIPSELGYGARGAGGVIPPNADLLFEVELLGKPGRR